LPSATRLFAAEKVFPANPALLFVDRGRLRRNIGWFWHPSLALPAAQRFSASSPHLLAWLDQWNEGRPYEEQVRPFGFLLVYTAKTGVFADPPNLECCIEDKPKRGRPPKRDLLKPIAPFSTDLGIPLHNLIDRVTGETVSPDHLKTYAEALCQYHLSSEDKFDNGQFLDQGRTERRHVVAAGLTLIGKEANRVGDNGEGDSITPTVATLLEA
jgi:hypothetical protein